MEYESANMDIVTFASSDGGVLGSNMTPLA